SETYLAFAKALLRKGEFLEALDYFQKSLVSNARNFDGTEMNENPSYEDVINPQIILESLTLKTQTLFSLANKTKGTEKTALLEAALKTASTGTEVSHHLRQAYKVESSKLHLIDQTRPLFETAIAICDELFKETGKNQWLNQAFQFSEQSKAIVLFEAVKASGAKAFAGIPQTLLEKEATLKRELDFYTQKAWENTDEAWEEKRFRLYNDYEEFVTRLEKEYPEYYQLKYDAKISDVAKTRSLLTHNMAMISFFQGDQSTYIFTLTKDNLDIKKIEPGLLEEEKIKAYYRHISDAGSKEGSFHLYSLELYEALIKKPLAAHQHIDKLIIIPDGLLGYIPFDLLLTEKPELAEDAWDYRRFPWLIYKYQISYAYSATLLKENIDRKTTSSLPYIGFAPKYENSSAKLAMLSQDGSSSGFRGRGSVEGYFDLPGAREEVQAANSIFDGQIYLGAEATERKIKELKQNASILHLAMHATVNDQNPLQSRLIFSPEPDSSEDGILNVFEIYNMALKSQLTVLSACNTGYGEIRKGEGVISLSRAFMYAGCPSILTTLWRAKDQTTQDIVSGFFRNLKEGKNRAEALHQAKLDYLASADPLKAHPVHWANFVLIGNPEPLEEGLPLWIWGLIGIGVVLAGGVFLWLRNNKFPS
ncbi:MAG: CHAT domain-containing protein, partial [Bacteroidetes bacterium]|nr:CHAT domain-containing protein [Bacteroidota bacterium]